MGPALAVLAAFLFAIGTVLQQKGTLSTEAGENDPRFLVQILRRPVWLVGAAMMASGFVVQSLVALSLVIALPLGAILTDQHIGRRELLGAGLTLVGIIFFVSAGQPQGGNPHPGAAAWWTAVLVIYALVIVLFFVGARFSGAAKALTYGAAAGLGYGLQAAVTKTFVTEVGSGILALLSSWSIYVLILSALTGFALQQSSLKTGVLAPAMASANSVSLFTSVILGIAVYDEMISKSGAGHTSSAFIGLAIALVGIALLAGSAEPETSEQPTTNPSPAT